MSQGRWTRAVVRAGIVALLTSALGVGAIPAAHAVEGLQVDGKSVYRLDPKAGRVHVTVTARLTNTMPAQTVGAYIRTPYFDSFGVPALGPLKNIKARSSAGGSLDTKVETVGAGLSVVVVDLSPNLVHGSPQTLTVEYDIPGQRPRSKFATRINQGFGGWAVLGTGDPGKVDIVIDVPAAFEVTVSKPVEVQQSRRGPRQIYRMDRIRDLENAFLFASALNDDRLVEKQLTVADTDVTVKAWPGDTRWQTFASRWVTRGLPAVGEVMGLEVPEDELSIVESSRAYQLGFAGFYVPVLGTVEVGDELDETTILHELTHVWFNDEMFPDRWISEGLAEEVANRALTELGEKPKNPKPIKRNARGSIKLNAWEPMQPLDRTTVATEQFAYNASYAVIHEIVDEIGEDGLQKVLAAASDRQIPYQGDPEPEELRAARDWHYFFDLVTIIGGSRKALQLFENHVVLPTDGLVLDQRTSALAALKRLEQDGDGWTPPLAIRENMAGWKFVTAESSIEEATGLLTRARDAVDQLAGAGVHAAAPKLEGTYESAESLVDLETTVEEYENLAQQATAIEDRAAEANPVAKLGLVGTDLGLGDLNAAIDKDQLGNAPAIFAAAAKRIDQATLRGAVILGVLLLVIVALLFMLRRRRRRKARAVTSDEILIADEVQINVTAEREPVDPLGDSVPEQRE